MKTNILFVSIEKAFEFNEYWQCISLSRVKGALFFNPFDAVLMILSTYRIFTTTANYTISGKTEVNVNLLEVSDKKFWRSLKYT